MFASTATISTTESIAPTDLESEQRRIVMRDFRRQEIATVLRPLAPAE